MTGEKIMRKEAAIAYYLFLFTFILFVYTEKGQSSQVETGLPPVPQSPIASNPLDLSGLPEHEQQILREQLLKAELLDREVEKHDSNRARQEFSDLADEMTRNCQELQKGSEDQGREEEEFTTKFVNFFNGFMDDDSKNDPKEQDHKEQDHKGQDQKESEGIFEIFKNLTSSGSPKNPALSHPLKRQVKAPPRTMLKNLPLLSAWERLPSIYNLDWWGMFSSKTSIVILEDYLKSTPFTSLFSLTNKFYSKKGKLKEKESGNRRQLWTQDERVIFRKFNKDYELRLLKLNQRKSKSSALLSEQNSDSAMQASDEKLLPPYYAQFHAVAPKFIPIAGQKVPNAFFHCLPEPMANQQYAFFFWI